MFTFLNIPSLTTLLQAALNCIEHAAGKVVYYVKKIKFDSHKRRYQLVQNGKIWGNLEGP